MEKQRYENKTIWNNKTTNKLSKKEIKIINNDSSAQTFQRALKVIFLYYITGFHLILFLKL